MKFIDWIYKKIKEIQIKNFSKIVCVFKNDRYTKYLVPGEKTKARFQAMRAIICCFEYVYGKRIAKLCINGLHINENDECITINVYTAKPGLIIGKMGSDVDTLEETLTKVFKTNTKISLYEEPILYGNRSINIINFY